jgi:hypothetical protein
LADRLFSSFWPTDKGEYIRFEYIHENLINDVIPEALETLTRRDFHRETKLARTYCLSPEHQNGAEAKRVREAYNRLKALNGELGIPSSKDQNETADLDEAVVLDGTADLEELVGPDGAETFWPLFQPQSIKAMRLLVQFPDAMSRALTVNRKNGRLRPKILLEHLSRLARAMNGFVEPEKKIKFNDILLEEPARIDLFTAAQSVLWHGMLALGLQE